MHWDSPDGAGFTKRDKVKNDGGYVVDPDIPLAGQRLWGIFWRVGRTRRSGMETLEALQPSEVEAWCRLACEPLTPGEFDVLMDMDEARLGRGTPPAVKEDVRYVSAVGDDRKAQVNAIRKMMSSFGAVRVEREKKSA